MRRRVANEERDVGVNTHDKRLVGTLWKRLKADPRQVKVWRDLAFAYARHSLVWQAGYAARQTIRLDASLSGVLQDLKIGNWRDPQSGDAVLGQAGWLPDESLRAQCSAWLKQAPGDWLTWLYWARLKEIALSPGAAPDPEVAQAIGRARELEIIPGETWHCLGVWRLQAGDDQGALAALSELSAIHPIRFGSMMYLGEAQLRLGRVAEAERSFGVAARSGNPEFLSTLASRVFANNYWQEALTILERALELRPSSLPILLQKARIESDVYALAACRATLERIAALDPENLEARLLYAGFQGKMGDGNGYLTTLLAQYEAVGDPLSRLASSIVMTSLYHDTLTPEEVADLHRRMCAPIEEAISPQTVFTNPRTSGRRLRVGFLTGDLHRQHPVNIFMLPVLQRLDHARLEIGIYYTGSMHDEYTRLAMRCADRWVACSGMEDALVHRLIVADGVDLLIDLAGHTSSHRLGVFAMRAAPVQATFLGYPHSTGLTRIDWLIGDATVTPIEQVHLSSEGVAQLPDCVFCWAPVDSYPLPPARPAEAPVVFGSFNNTIKLSARTLDLWARVLHEVPDSLLLLKAPALQDAGVRERFEGLFAARGIVPERLIQRGPCGLADMMQEYGNIDIALDPIPYNGGTTTLQAMWMGVPVVTLTGGNFVSRMGTSFARSCGQRDWVAESEDAYVRIAARLAGQCRALRGQRPALRSRMQNSPLCDIDTYAAHFTTLLERMWEVYVSGEKPEVLTLDHPSACTEAAVPPMVLDSPVRERALTSSTRKRDMDDDTLSESPQMEITTSRQMLAWMEEQKLSLALTTYQIGKLFLLGLKSNGHLSVFERTFNRCMGMCATENGFYLSSLYQVWRFENLFNAGEGQDGFDRLYVPQVGNTTGDLDIHDMAVDGEGRLVFVNTLFGCLATLSETHSFRPLWRPPFISKLAAEDRCHLNGLAMKAGKPAFVTIVGESDVVDGWRELRSGGGIVMDVASNEIVARGLSMPHSPRWHQGRLWLLNAGSGEFGYVEPESGRFEPVTFCAGYLRGLHFHGDFALVGTSLPRHNRTFTGLPLDEMLQSRNAQPRCGIQVIDLRTGDAVHWLRFEGLLSEIYDVIALPGVRCPMALGFKTDEIRRVLSVDSA